MYALMQNCPKLGETSRTAVDLINLPLSIPLDSDVLERV